MKFRKVSEQRYLVIDEGDNEVGEVYYGGLRPYTWRVVGDPERRGYSTRRRAGARAILITRLRELRHG